MAWTVASQPLLVPNPSCVGRRYRLMSSQTVARSKCLSHGHRSVAGVLLIQCCESCAGDPGDNGAGNVAVGHDADHGGEGRYPGRRPPFDVLWVEAQQSCCRVLRKGKEGVLDHGERGEGDGRNREEPPPALSTARGGGMAVSHLFGELFEVGSWRFVKQGGAGLGELALLRQGRGPVVSSLKVAHIVMRVCGVVVRFRLVRGFCQRVPPACSSQRRLVCSSSFASEGQVGPGSGVVL